VVGSPVANRTRVETEGLIGFFANTILLRGDLSGNPYFRELLKRVREAVLDAHAYQALPFEQLVDRLQPERNLSHHPLFQVMFVYQNGPGLSPGVSRLAEAAVPVETGTTKFDLTMEVTQTEHGLGVEMEYDVDLFDARTIAGMAERFRILLEAIAEAPERSVSELPLLTEAERRFLLAEANDTRADYPASLGVEDAVETQARLNPSKVAVYSSRGRLSYGELDARANRLAHYLRRKGVGPDVLVGVCLRRSPEMFVALLAILKAGGA